MWLSLVTTITCAVLADAGYLYNAPPVHSSLRYHHQQHQHAPVHQVHHSRPHDYKIVQTRHDGDKITYSISYKDYVYIKQEHPHQASSNYNNVQVHGNAHNNIGHTHNGYDAHAQPVTSNVNYHNNYVQPLVHTATNTHSHPQHAVTPVNINNGYMHTHQSPATSSYSNSYVQASPTGVAHNTGYTQTVTAPETNNYNSYSQITGPSAPAVNLNNAYSQTSVSTETSNLNSGYVSATATNDNGWQPIIPQTSSYSNIDSNQHSSQANAPLNNGYSQVYSTDAYSYNQPSSTSNNGYSQVHSTDPYSYNQPSSTSNNGYSQVAQGNPEVNTAYSQVAHNAPVGNGYSQSHEPLNNGQNQVAVSSVSAHSPSFDSTNGYLHSVASSASANFNTGYAQASSSTLGTNVNNGYDQNLPTGNANFNTGYPSASISSSSTVNNALAPSLTATANGISTTSYSEGPTHIDLNFDTTQTLASASLGSSNTQSLVSGSDNLNNGFDSGLVQNNVGTNPIPATPAVAPIIHKHIYFHVPPPEIEEPVTPAPPPPPPKKNYKILFIKVPSQESKTNVARLQQQIEQMQNAVEEKTLIYVLVKKPEEPKPVVLPEPKPSEHQVYFVKYGGNPLDIAAQVNDEFDKTGSVQSIVPLEPGLVNGQHK